MGLLCDFFLEWFDVKYSLKHRNFSLTAIFDPILLLPLVRIALYHIADAEVRG
jgi:hypothetical protein